MTAIWGPMWADAAPVQLRWFFKDGKFVLQHRNRMTHVHGWEPDAWGDWTDVPFIDESPHVPRED